MKKRAIIAMMIPLISNAGQDGSGGGGFCFDSGKCVTVAEAGFRVQSDIPVPVLSSELILETESIIDNLAIDKAFQSYFKNEVFASPGTFQRVKSYSSKGLAKIKKEYESLLKKNNMVSDNLVIYAISTRQTTYLLPEFDKLNLRSQALILIHEGIVRKTGSVLAALKMDGLILDAMAGDNNAAPIVAQLVTADDRSSSDNGYLGSYALVAYVREVSQKWNKYVSAKEILSDMVSTNNWGEEIYCLNSKQEQRLYNDHNSLWKVMSDLKLRCFSKILNNGVSGPIRSDELTYAEKEKVCNAVGNGDVLVPINYKTDEWYSNKGVRIRYEYERAPRVLVGLNCKDSQIVDDYEISFSR